MAVNARAASVCGGTRPPGPVAVRCEQAGGGGHDRAGTRAAAQGRPERALTWARIPSMQHLWQCGKGTVVSTRPSAAAAMRPRLPRPTRQSCGRGVHVAPGGPTSLDPAQSGQGARSVPGDCGGARWAPLRRPRGHTHLVDCDPPGSVRTARSKRGPPKWPARLPSMCRRAGTCALQGPLMSPGRPVAETGMTGSRPLTAVGPRSACRCAPPTAG